MLRIAIFTGDERRSQDLFARSQSAAKKLKVQCEISLILRAENILQKLSASSSYYDVYIFDASSEECLRLSERIRRVNVSPSFIFTVKKEFSELHSIIPFRPSQAIITDGGEEELTEALRFSILEQIRIRPYFVVKNKGSTMRIGYGSISYFESNQRKIILHTAKQIIEFYGKLSDVEDLLPDDTFLRVHQSYIVNMSKVKSLDKIGRTFEMMSGTSIEISKSQYQSAVTKYEEYLEKT